MSKTYKIENPDSGPVAFPVAGGVEVVSTGQTRTLELKRELDKEAIEAFEEKGIKISPSTAKPENVLATRVEPEEIKPADDPGETGGLTPRSPKSEEGGVKRAAGDTTTTTKPTTKHVGPVA